nr:metallopeptidase TldD-related protein [Acidobacteriota bacterium]
MLLTEKEAKAITEKMLSFVKANDATVSVGSEDAAHIRFAENSFLTSGKRENRAANVTVWIEGKRGSSSTNDLNENSLRQAVEQAEQIARLAPVDREYIPTLGRQTYRAVNGFVEATANISPAARAKAVGGILAESEKAKIIAAGFYQSQAEATAFATKNGNFGFQRNTVAGLSVTGRTSDGTSSGYFARSHFDANKLDTARIAREAIRRTLDGRNAKTLEAGVYTVILEPQAVADLLGSFGGGFDARSAEEGRSPYSALGGKTKLGAKVFDERINILSDPWNLELPGAQSAQAGIPAQKIYLVKNGVLNNLVYSRFWAKQK